MHIELLKQFKNIESELQAAINIIENFFETWCLTINMDKTAYCIFTTAGYRASYKRIYNLENFQITDHMLFYKVYELFFFKINIYEKYITSSIYFKRIQP